MRFYWNKDSRVFALRRFFNLNTNRHWWLLNLVLFTITTED